MQKLLFVCIHNSARSQMAEAFARRYGAGRINAYSAGIEPGRLNARVVQVMAEIGIDISAQPCRSVQQHLREQGEPDWLITVCDGANAGRCPSVSAGVQCLHWEFDDPSALVGSEAEQLAQTRLIRDQIDAKVRAFCEQL